MTEHRSRPRPADFAWNDPEPVQQEPTGPALGNYPAEPDGSSPFGLSEMERWDRLTRDRRVAWNERVARFLDKLADRARGWH